MYAITETGREELRQWLLTPVRPHTPHSAELIQVFFAGQLSDAEMLTIFERAADKVRAILSQYTKVPQQADAYADTMESPRDFFCWMLTLDAGFRSAQANLAWIEDVIQKIRNHEVPPAQ